MAAASSYRFGMCATRSQAVEISPETGELYARCLARVLSRHRAEQARRKVLPNSV